MPMNQKLNKLELMNNNQSDLMMRAEMHKNIYILFIYCINNNYLGCNTRPAVAMFCMQMNN